MQLNARVALVVAGVAAVLTTVVACNNHGVSVGSSGGTVTGSGPSGPSAPRPPPTAGAMVRECASTMPSRGATCSAFFDGTCEYGQSVDPACNDRASCRNGTWEVEEPTCPPTCPSHFDDRAPGEACGESLCTYLEATCGCVGAVGAADAGILLDSGHGGDDPDSGTTLGAWQCVRPGNGCPARRPLPGTVCPTPMDCDYGSCLFDATSTGNAGRHALSVSCFENVWVETTRICP